MSSFNWPIRSQNCCPTDQWGARARAGVCGGRGVVLVVSCYIRPLLRHKSAYCVLIKAEIIIISKCKYLCLTTAKCSNKIFNRTMTISGLELAWRMTVFHSWHLYKWYFFGRVFLELWTNWGVMRAQDTRWWKQPMCLLSTDQKMLAHLGFFNLRPKTWKIVPVFSLNTGLGGDWGGDRPTQRQQL